MNQNTERRYKRVESKGECLAQEIIDLAANLAADGDELTEFVRYCADLGLGDVDPLVRLKIVKFKAQELLKRHGDEMPSL